VNRSTSAVTAFFALAAATVAAGLLEAPGSFDVAVRLDGSEMVVLVRASKSAPLLLFCHKPRKKSLGR
jgi:hypothetical protein